MPHGEGYDHLVGNEPVSRQFRVGWTEYKTGRRLKEKSRVATVNENHARELMELHTISPDAGYAREDVIALSHVMAACFDVDFNFMRKRAFWDEPLPDRTDTLFNL